MLLQKGYGWMQATPIYFQFAEKKEALQAMDTLHELGFEANWLEHAHPEHKPTLQVYVERSDLTSALEIAQAHGGMLHETSDGGEETYASAYALDGIAIPAHAIAGDESYDAAEAVESYSGTTSDNSEAVDPMEDDYSRFSAGIHL